MQKNIGVRGFTIITSKIMMPDIAKPWLNLLPQFYMLKFFQLIRGEWVLYYWHVIEHFIKHFKAHALAHFFIARNRLFQFYLGGFSNWKIYGLTWFKAKCLLLLQYISLTLNWQLPTLITQSEFTSLCINAVYKVVFDIHV